MSALAKERTAVVVITALLLGTDLTAPRVAAAITAVVFFWWVLGRVHTPRPPSETRDAAEPTGQP